MISYGNVQRYENLGYGRSEPDSKTVCRIAGAHERLDAHYADLEGRDSKEP